MKIGALLETQKHQVNDILLEALMAEEHALDLYYKLLGLVKDKAVFIEEYARKMISLEELHVGEVNKMLRKPGEVKEFSPQ